MRVRFMFGLALSAMTVAVLSTAFLVAPSRAHATESNLVYADEFDSAPDAAAWATLTPWNTRYTIGQLEYYDPDNVSCSDGCLHLTSDDRAVDGFSYTSGILTSLERQEFSYGYFEIRAKLPKGQGIWPAFWLINNDCTLEIDAFEMLGNKPGRLYMTLHENDKTIHQGVYNGPDYSGGYHTYGVDWQPTYIRWYIDGVCRAQYVHAIPDDPLWICLDTAIGGSWPGAPDASTHFPQSYDIDYVRVYDHMPASATVSHATAVKATVTASTRAPVEKAATPGQSSASAAAVGGAASSVLPSSPVATPSEDAVSLVGDGGGLPSVALDVPTSCVGCAWARASAAAALSDVDHVEMKLDAGAWVNTTLLSTAEPGRHVVYARAFDIAGRERDTVRTFEVVPANMSMATMALALLSYQVQPAL